MKIKTSELTGAALNYMVHVAKGNSMHACAYWLEKYADEQRREFCESYSEDWREGGPIIERESIATQPCEDMESWAADTMFKQGVDTHYGTTPLIAAMRVFVASKLGDEVDVPEELL